MLSQSEVVFISHGGGPMPLLGDPSHAELVTALTELGQRLQRPEAVVVISAHWESPMVAITSAAQPSLLYDYHGFPAEAYALQYPCSGAPALAERMAHALQSQGVAVRLDEVRGLDHGVFVPLSLMLPNADVPCLQISLRQDLDPQAHIALGQALATLHAERLLIVGSGFSFHNMRAFFTASDARVEAANAAFEDWLQETLTAPRSADQVNARLLQWTAAPAARFCHPREEHLLPLHVCYGITQRPAPVYQRIRVLGRQASLFHWPCDTMSQAKN